MHSPVSLAHFAQAEYNTRFTSPVSFKFQQPPGHAESQIQNPDAQPCAMLELRSHGPFRRTPVYIIVLTVASRQDHVNVFPIVLAYLVT